MADDKHYEMLWDCPNCDTKGLLGLTHRYCPSCGSPQDPASRYFPPDDAKVAVEDHVFVGADRRCLNCDTPNSAAASFCTSCGGPLDDSVAVAVRGEQEVGAPPSPLPAPAPSSDGPPSKTPWGCLTALLALLVLICGGVLVYAFWTTEAALEVTGHHWTRTIDVEVYKTVEDQAWHDQLPAGAHDVRCRDKKRDTRQVPDGEDCKTVNIDQGDGTFTQEERCTTRYRTEDVLDRYCDYTIERWVRERTARSEGDGLEPSPAWPALSLRTCAALGCEREGPRNETYTVTFASEDGPLSCDGSDEVHWRTFAPGSAWIGQIRLDGSLVCGSLEPAP